MAPGKAMLRTLHRSLIEKWRPTPNISRMTPISANWLAMLASPTIPGVKGPMAMPARRYPTIGGMLSRWAAKPPKNASTKPIVIVTTSEVSWGICVLLHQCVLCAPIMRHWLHSEYFSPAPLNHRRGSPCALGGCTDCHHFSQHKIIVGQVRLSTRKKHARAKKTNSRT